jgi:hypothetical protein
MTNWIQSADLTGFRVKERVAHMTPNTPDKRMAAVYGLSDQPFGDGILETHTIGR